MAGHRGIESDRLCKEQERARADKLRISWVACEGSSPMVMHLGDSQCVQADALDNGWKPHPERNNQTTGNESWSRSGNVRFKRRQLGGRDGH